MCTFGQCPVAAPGIKVGGGGCSPSPPFTPLPPFPSTSHALSRPSHFPFPPPFLFLPFPRLPIPSLSLPPHCREAAPLNPARGSGERCKLPQRRNRIWCILALKSDIWWQYILVIFLRIN